MSSNRMAVLALAIGAFLILIAPSILTQFHILSFNDTGPIGDTIGGITAPISSMMGAILVFLALKEQVTANKLIQEQVKEAKEEGRDLQITQLYIDRLKMLKADLATFEYIEQIKVSGVQAVIFTLNKMRNHNWGCNGDNFQPKFEEYSQIISSFDFLVFDLFYSSTLIKPQSGMTIINLIDHEFKSKIYPAIHNHKITDNDNEKRECQECKKHHQGVPKDFYDKIDDIRGTIDRVKKIFASKLGPIG